MSELSAQIDSDIIAAIKSGDNQKRDTLRLIKSAISSYKIDNQLPEITNETVLEIIAKEIKKRKESVTAYQQANREELAQSEQQEIDILSQYLPAQLSEEELRSQIETYLAENPADKTQMGRVMSELKAQFANKADLSLVSKIVQEKL